MAWCLVKGWENYTLLFTEIPEQKLLLISLLFVNIGWMLWKYMIRVQFNISEG